MEEATSPLLTLESKNEIGPHRKGIFSVLDVGYPHNDNQTLGPLDPTTEALPPDSDALSPYADAFAPAGTPFAYSMAATRTVPEGPARRLARLRRETATLLETVVTNMDSAPAPAPATIVRVVHSYEAVQPDELDLVVGENIVVLDAFEDDWALGLLPGTGRKGAFPLACTVRFDDEVILAHINSIQTQVEELSQKLESNVKAKSLPRASRHKLSPGEELIAKLHAFSRAGHQQNHHINTSIGIPSKPAATARHSPEQNNQALAHASEDLYGSVSYDLFYSKVDDSAGPLVDLTMLDFRITSLEATIGASLPMPQPKNEPHSRERVSSMSSKHRLTSSITHASSPPLPPSLPLPPSASVSAPVSSVKGVAASSNSLLLTLEESTMRLQRLLYTLESQVHDPPNIDPVLQSMENLLAIQKELKETPIPNMKPKDAWQVVTTPNRRNRAKPTLPPLSATSQRILQLHEALQPMDKLVASIPAIVNRLDSLVGLHTRAAQLSDAVIGIRAAHTLSVDRLGSVEDVLEVVDRGIKRNTEVCTKNFDALEDRVKSLLKRLDAVAYLAE
ncbi:hypothetical protein HDU77_000789 [Chytriomyces hyalinus]|nr:hypothetical protein HDU77_000789 [Chytriomyces hyalinus]